MLPRRGIVSWPGKKKKKNIKEKKRKIEKYPLGMAVLEADYLG